MSDRDCPPVVLDCGEQVCNEENDTCVIVPDDADCDDGDACNGVETCDPANGCIEGLIQLCDDRDACNGIEICDPATGCGPGTPLVCDDGDVCTDDSCDPAIGCVTAPDVPP